MSLKTRLVKTEIFLKRNWAQITLIAAVLLSVVLSAFIWLQVVNQDKVQVKRSSTSEASVTIDATTSLYMLNELIYTDDTGSTNYFIENRDSLTKLSNIMKNWQVGRVSEKSYSTKQYLKEVRQERTVLFGFGRTVSNLGVAEAIGKQFKLPKNVQVNFIQVPSSDYPTEVRLFDDLHKKIYTFSVILAKKTPKDVKFDGNHVRANLVYQKHSLRIKLLQAIPIQVHSYLLGEDSVENYVNALFAGKDVPQRNFQSGDEIIYNDGASRQLSEEQQNGKMTFDYYSSKDDGDDLNERIKFNTDWVQKIHQSADNLGYFSSSDEGRKMQFRLFVDGIPVFNNSDYGAVQVTQISKRHLRMKFSKYTLKVPLPTSKAEVVMLPTVETKMAELKKANVSTDDIEDWTMGYQWITNNDDKIVTLRPMWFVELKDHAWQSVDEYAKEHTNETGGN
ncbi:MAG: two-component system activity regulator YycH [Lactobacillaceae bacterium]|nr:two-component system activity regulator YycH [Lactobacillaceae bacterium]